MKVSCILPVYNASSYVKEAIQSILNQTYRNFELIIIDDCSRDDSWEIISELQKKYPDIIRAFKNDKNLGLPATLNRALKVATGELIARMDADDISNPERFSQQVQFLSAHESIGIVGTLWRYMNNGVIPEVPLDHDSMKLYTLLNNPIGHPTVMFRKKEIIEEIGSYDETAHTIEDFEFWCRCLDRTRAQNLPQVLLDYRIHSHQISSASSSKQNIQLRKVRVAQATKVLKVKKIAERFIDILDMQIPGRKLAFEFTIIAILFAFINIFNGIFKQSLLNQFLFKNVKSKLSCFRKNKRNIYV